MALGSPRRLASTLTHHQSSMMFPMCFLMRSSILLFFFSFSFEREIKTGLTSGEQSAGASIWLAPSNPTVAVFANQSYFVSCKAPGAEKIVWTKVGEGDITPTSGK